MMKLFSAKMVAVANYGMWRQQDVDRYSDDLDAAFEKFTARCIPQRGKFEIPYYWAPAVLEFMNRALSQDPAIVFQTIKEEHGVLRVDFFCSHIVDENAVEDMLAETKNQIVKLMHHRVNFADREGTRDYGSV